MRTGDAIVAPASPPGRSARAMVRVSGPGARETLAALGCAWPGTRSLTRTALRLPCGDLPALLACYPAPASYTGEDCAEIQIPGSPLLVQRVLDAMIAQGRARPAAPGEFTARAFLNAKLGIEQAEGVAMTIGARTEAELRAARALLAGQTGARYGALADDLAGALALLEAGIDFTDQEDVVAIAPSALLERLQRVRAGASGLLRRGGGAGPTGDDPVVVLVGRPSAGKSTLFNALLGRRRAAVHESPGTTRDAIRETLELADVTPGLRVTLVDLAGIDAAFARAGAADAAAQRAAREAVSGADAVVLCDPAGRFDLDAGLPAGAPVVRVRTKADVPGAGGEELGVCALDLWNIGALRRAIADAALGAASGGGATLLPRHRAALARAERALDEAIRRIEPAASARSVPDEELIAGAMREALDALGEISGRISPDDVIGRVFATFCVGK